MQLLIFAFVPELADIIRYFTLFMITARVTPRRIVPAPMFGVGAIQSVREIFKRLNFLTNGARFFSLPLFSVFYSMFRIVRTKLQVFNAIIVSNFIYMMNLFNRKKVAPNMFFHNKSVFKSITSTICSTMCIGVIRRIDIDISIRSFISTFEIRRFFSRLESARHWVSKIFHIKNVASIGHKSRSICTGVLAALVLGGCTINIEDKRLTREEVLAAFQQRDAALKDLTASMKAIDAKIEVKKK